MASKNKVASCIRCNHVFCVRDPLAPRGNRCPHILHCGHSICEHCLITALQVDASVACTKCSQQSLQKQSMKNISKEFPINLYVIGQFIERSHHRFPQERRITFVPPITPGSLSSTVSNVSVNVPGAELPTCDECSKIAEWYCENCPANYCSSCFTHVHAAARSLQTHIRAPIQSQASPKCEIHGEKKDFFCNQCNEVLCACCAIGLHSGHPVITRAQMNEEQMDNVHAAVMVAGAVLEEITKSQQELQAMLLLEERQNLHPPRKQQEHSQRKQQTDAEGKGGGGGGGNVADGLQLAEVEIAVTRHFAFLHGLLQLQETALLEQLSVASGAVEEGVRLALRQLKEAAERTRATLLEASRVGAAGNLKTGDLRDLTRRLLDTRHECCRVVHPPSTPSASDGEADDQAAAASDTAPRCSFKVKPEFASMLASHCHLDLVIPSIPMLEPMGDSPPTTFAPMKPSTRATSSAVGCVDNTAADETPIEMAALPNIVDNNNFAPSEKVSEVQLSNPTNSAGSSVFTSPKSASDLRSDSCATIAKLDAVAAAATTALENFGGNTIVSKSYSTDGASTTSKSSGISHPASGPPSTSKSSGFSHPSSGPPSTSKSSVFSHPSSGPPSTSKSSGSSHPASKPNRRVSRGRTSKRGRGPFNRFGDIHTNAASTKPSGMIQPISSASDLRSGFSVPTLIESKHSQKVLSTTTFPAGFNSERPPPKPFVAIGKPEVVQVVHIKSPSSFFVHRYQDKSILENLQLFLDSCPERDYDPLNSVTKGQMYICKFLVDDKWYRVTVKNYTAMLNPPESRDAIVDIFYVDYGNCDQVPLSGLRPLPTLLEEVPPYALHCCLFDVHPKNGSVWSEDAHRTFCKMVNGARVHMNVMSFKDDMYHIDLCAIPGLKNSNFPVSARDAMIFMELAFLEDESQLNIRQSSARFDSEYLKKEPLSKGEHFPVVLSHIDNPSQFYAQRRGTHAEYLAKLLDEMSQYYKNNKNDMIYNPGVGMPCAAQFSLDKSWYRAQVMSIPRKSWVEVFYVDYGNREEIPYTDIRKMPEKFMRIPPQAIECTLADVMPVSGNKWLKLATSYFLSITKDKELRLLVEDVSKPYTKAILYEEKETVDICLNALLVKEGHALMIGVGASLVEYVKAPIPGDTCLESPKSFESAIKPTRKKVRKACKADPGGVGFMEAHNSSNIKSRSRVNDKESSKSGPPLRVPVTIVTIKSPGFIYVRPCSNEEDIVNLMKDMQDFYYATTISRTEWKETDKCAVWKEKDKKWLRAVILQILDNDVKVFYKDIAVTEIVSIDNLRILEERFASIHDGAMRCHLAGIKAAGGIKWSSVACEMLADLVLNTYSELYITKKGEIEENSLPIELWARCVVSPEPLEPDRVDWISLNQVLVDNGMAIPTTMPESLEILQADCCSSALDSVTNNAEMDRQEVNEKRSSESSDESTSNEEDTGNRQELLLCPENPRRQWLPAVPLKMHHFTGLVTNVDDDGFIYLHNFDDNETLGFIKEAITNFVGDSKPKPQDMYWFEGQICLAQFENDKFWYRGKILKAKENNMYEVLFVDYGNVELCGIEMLRKNVIMTDIPILCRTYQLDEIQPADCNGKWKREHLDFLHRTLDGKHSKVSIKSSIKDDIPKISLTLPGSFDVAQLLVSMHYAIYSTNVMNNSTVSEDSLEDVIIEKEEISELFPSSIENEVKNTEKPNTSKNAKVIEAVEDTNTSSKENCEENEKEKCSKIGSKLHDNETECEFTEHVHGQPVHSDSCNSNEANMAAGELLKSEHLSSIDMLIDAKNADAINSSTFRESADKAVEEYGIQKQDKKNQVICEDRIVCTLKDEEKNIYDSSEKRTVSNVKPAECEIESNDVPGVKTQELVCILNENKSHILWSEDIENLENKNIQMDRFSFKRLNLENCDTLSVQATTVMDSLTEIVMIPEKNGNEEIVCREDFDFMTLQIQNEAPFQPAIEMPYVGQACCAQYFEDDQYYRGFIVEIGDNSKVRVEFVDYGNIEWLEINRVHHIKPSWINIPVQGIKCHLWNLKIAEKCDKSVLLKDLSDLIFNRSLTAKIKRKHPLAVDLYIPNTECLVYQPLLDNNLLVQIIEEKCDQGKTSIEN